ncbi:hypothetical protein G9A89_017953 [Geosiphon pyriformis]|nr:hypothetical protein G9A89_017953 [Geosiphon pyriformis]
MFFFFLGGLSSKLTRLSTPNPAHCPNCFAPTMYQYKSAKVLSIFFIPIFKFHKKILWICERCGCIQTERPNDGTGR